MPETVDGSLSVVLSFGQQMCIKHLVDQLVKNLPAVQETPVGFLGWEDSLREGMATHSSILAWRILLTEEPGGLQLHVGDLTTWRFKESDMTEQLITETMGSNNGLDRHCVLGAQASPKLGSG